MQLLNDFTIAASAEHAWPLLTDLHRVVSCLPGASLESVDCDAFRGSMQIKVGPMNLSYQGEGKFSPNEQTRTIVVEANGTEKRGAGGAAATITAELDSVNTLRTRVRVTTDLDLSGKPAQFGRGIVIDVARRLLSTFAANLEAALHEAPPGPKSAPTPEAVADEPLALGVAGISGALKLVAPTLAASAVFWLIMRRLVRRPRWSDPRRV